jgi:hypothetical protein
LHACVCGTWQDNRVYKSHASELLPSLIMPFARIHVHGLVARIIASRCPVPAKMASFAQLFMKFLKPCTYERARRQANVRQIKPSRPWRRSCRRCAKNSSVRRKARLLARGSRRRPSLLQACGVPTLQGKRLAALRLASDCEVLVCIVIGSASAHDAVC